MTRLTRGSVRMNMITCRFHDLNDTNLTSLIHWNRIFHRCKVTWWLIKINQMIFYEEGSDTQYMKDTRLTSSDQLSSLSGFNRLPMSVQKMNPTLQSNKPYGPAEVLRWMAVTFSRCISSPCFYNKRSCLNNIPKNLPAEYGLFEFDTMLTIPDDKLFEFDSMLMVPDKFERVWWWRWDEMRWDEVKRYDMNKKWVSLLMWHKSCVCTFLTSLDFILNI